MKHTPAPWSCRKFGLFEQYGVQIGMDGGFILDKNLPNAEANARLMAAAPELLEALIEAVNEYKKLPHSLGYDFTHLPKMEKAIKKAKGE